MHTYVRRFSTRPTPPSVATGSYLPGSDTNSKNPSLAACASTIISIKKIAANPGTEAKRSDFWGHDGIQKTDILEKQL